MKFREFAVEFITVLLIFSKFSSIIMGFIFIRYSLVIVLHLESFKNNLFELDFSISKKSVSMVKPSHEGEFFERL